jgi:hypothetical protein
LQTERANKNNASGPDRELPQVTHKPSPSETGNAEQHSVLPRRPTTRVQLQFVLSAKTLAKKKRFNEKNKSQALIRDGRRSVAVARAW